jgi:hypothetical protein
LPEDIQDLWILELGRVLRTGGYAVLSFHGEKAYSAYINSLKNGRGTSKYLDLLSLNRLAALRVLRGFFYVKTNASAEKALPGYYGAAFHTIGYIQRNWCRSFRLRAWLPTFALDYQDVVVLEKL